MERSTSAHQRTRESSADDSRLETLVTNAVSGLRALQELQSAYDAVGWQVQEPGYAKARHVIYHLLSAVNELAATVEGVEHAQQRGESVEAEEYRDSLAAHPAVGAKLVFHAAQVANLADLDLGEELMRLYRSKATSFAPSSAFSRIDLPTGGATPR